MAGLGVYARKTWEKYRKDAESAKARKRREKNVADRSAAEKKIIQWRKDREKEERRKYVSDFDPLDDHIELIMQEIRLRKLNEEKCREIIKNLP